MRQLWKTRCTGFTKLPFAARLVSLPAESPVEVQFQKYSTPGKYAASSARLSARDVTQTLPNMRKKEISFCTLKRSTRLNVAD